MPEYDAELAELADLAVELWLLKTKGLPDLSGLAGSAGGAVPDFGAAAPGTGMASMEAAMKSGISPAK